MPGDSKINIVLTSNFLTNCTTKEGKKVSQTAKEEKEILMNEVSNTDKEEILRRRLKIFIESDKFIEGCALDKIKDIRSKEFRFLYINNSGLNEGGFEEAEERKKIVENMSEDDKKEHDKNNPAKNYVAGGSHWDLIVCDVKTDKNGNVTDNIKTENIQIQRDGLCSIKTFLGIIINSDKFTEIKEKIKDDPIKNDFESLETVNKLTQKQASKLVLKIIKDLKDVNKEIIKKVNNLGEKTDKDNYLNNDEIIKLCNKIGLNTIDDLKLPEINEIEGINIDLSKTKETSENNNNQPSPNPAPTGATVATEISKIDKFPLINGNELKDYAKEFNQNLDKEFNKIQGAEAKAGNGAEGAETEAEEAKAEAEVTNLEKLHEHIEKYKDFYQPDKYRGIGAECDVLIDNGKYFLEIKNVQEGSFCEENNIKNGDKFYLDVKVDNLKGLSEAVKNIRNFDFKNVLEIKEKESARKEITPETEKITLPSSSSSSAVSEASFTTALSPSSTGSKSQEETASPSDVKLDEKSTLDKIKEKVEKLEKTEDLKQFFLKEGNQYKGYSFKNIKQEQEKEQGQGRGRGE